MGGVDGIWGHNKNCCRSLPSDSTLTNKTTPDGRPYYTAINSDTGNRITLYQGGDGRWYDPKVKLARLMKDGSINDIELHPLTTAWLIKQSRELRASPPYAKTPWSKMTVSLDNQGEIKMNFEYLD